jgi:spore coat protein U-like protein
VTLRPVLCRAVIAAGLVAAPWRGLACQGNSAPLTARAQVLSGPIAVNRLRDLTFGTVTRGVATTVATNAPGAGEWQVTGSPNARVNMTFTLPTLLTNIQAAPGSTMPITFLNNSGRWRRANNNPNGGNQFNPAVGANGRLGPTANPTLYIWLGGRVTPAANAKPGIYSGTVIVTLIYI